jgi:glycosyltransferase involved in cell wall biosynthesis
MKKKLLFVMNNLNCGGAEKALISLLETLDYSKYEIDLFLFEHEGLFLNKIPKQVNLLSQPNEYQYFNMSVKKAVLNCLSEGKPHIAINRIAAGFIFRTERNKARCEQRVWKYISKSVNELKKEYDVAIGYLEKNPIYFCLEKVNAKKKIGFIHNDYEKLGMDSKIDMKYFKKLDHIVTVSFECANVLKKKFPGFKRKISVMHNIVSSQVINRLSLDSTPFNYEGVKLVSVGRLTYQKGFDIAIEACEKLIKEGLDFKWLIVGEGEERFKLESLIKEKQLEKNFILLGLKENPYPYIKAADIYIQPSRFEGKPIAIDEAKILRKPILVTNFSTAKDQITHEQNGLIVEMDANSVAIGLTKLINEENFRKKLSNGLSKENYSGTDSEINVFYKLINTK